MALGLDLRPGKANDPFGIYEDGASDDAMVLFAVHFFESPCPVGFKNFMLRIAQQPYR